jgi:hypothetical protein
MMRISYFSFKKGFKLTSAASQRQSRYILVERFTTKSPQSLKDRIVEMWKKYRFVAVSTYGAVYLVVFGGTFVALERKFINFEYVNKTLKERGYNYTIDPIHLIDSLVDGYIKITGLTAVKDFVDSHPQSHNLFLAFAITSFTDFIRIPLTIFLIPRVAKLFAIRLSKVGSAFK